LLYTFISEDLGIKLDAEIGKFISDAMKKVGCQG